MKIGVFDSGIGGEAVAEVLARAFPQAEVLVVNDRKNVPYGDKSQSVVTTLTDRAIQPLLKASCDVIVIACNTATALAIEYLRGKYPLQKFVGLEPMIKPASLQTKTKIIGVCATPATLNSQRYHSLKAEFTNGITVIEPDCSGWASLIEQNSMTDAVISRAVDSMLSAKVDVIVLACTHYHWIKERVVGLVDGRAVVIEPSEAIVNQVTLLLRD